MFIKRGDREYINLAAVVKLRRYKEKGLVILTFADGSEVRSTSEELRDKIDGINWDEDPPESSHNVYGPND